MTLLQSAPRDRRYVPQCSAKAVLIANSVAQREISFLLAKKIELHLTMTRKKPESSCFAKNRPYAEDITWGFNFPQNNILVLNSRIYTQSG